ncbi:MAG: acyltransferase [Nitrospirota bacterium]|nr:acyltransferase [Nitrospirota bacterium]
MHSKHPHLIHPKYRPDIDGLRAVAILSVILFHLFPGKMKGGFIGVDIFFVISGFLISTIVFSSLERDRFSIVEFYIRRIRRIFPALILVMTVAFAAGWFLLFSGEFKQLGKHVAGGAGFVSNFILRTESGYFDAAAETKPLLHLWSLAIEEQFYVFWPLLLAFVWKRHWNFLKITAAIAIASFAANIHLINTSPESAFYLPFSRFWELMAGGVLAYIALHRPRLNSRYPNGQSLLGFALLATALLLLDKHSAFPGWWALLPAAGTFLVISAGPQAWLNKTFLANRAMVLIGLISYPLYLWHWVILAYVRIEDSAPSRQLKIAVLTGSILLAWFTYVVVENPLRTGRNPGTKATVLLSAMVVLFAAGFFTFSQNGLESWRHDGDRYRFMGHFENSLPEMAYFKKIGEHETSREDCNFYDVERYRNGASTKVPVKRISERCYLRDTAFSRSVFIWGDSHAQHLYHGIRNNLPASEWQVLIVASWGAHPDPHADHPSKTDFRQQSNWFALKAISEARPDVVVVAQESGHSPAAMREIADTLKGMGVGTVLFTGPVPHWKPSLPRLIARKLWNNTPERTLVGIDRQVIARDQALKAGFPRMEGARYVSLIDFFCNREGCLTRFGDDRVEGITTYDYGHLTPATSDRLGRELLAPIISGDPRPESNGW